MQLRARDLGQDVRGGAEAVQADPLRVAGHPQRAVSDQPRAQQRRRLQVRVAVGQHVAFERLAAGGVETCKQFLHFIFEEHEL